MPACLAHLRWSSVVPSHGQKQAIARVPEYARDARSVPYAGRLGTLGFSAFCSVVFMINLTNRRSVGRVRVWCVPVKWYALALTLAKGTFDPFPRRGYIVFRAGATFRRVACPCRSLPREQGLGSFVMR